MDIYEQLCGERSTQVIMLNKKKSIPKKKLRKESKILSTLPYYCLIDARDRVTVGEAHLHQDQFKARRDFSTTTLDVDTSKKTHPVSSSFYHNTLLSIFSRATGSDAMWGKRDVGYGRGELVLGLLR